MTKDPAVSFYTYDFILGTAFMSDEQRGQYILLLCLQHQKGFLYEKEMIKICGAFDEVIWKKFEKHGDKFENPRMKLEAEKRRSYCESRGSNGKGSNKDMKKISKSYGTLMGNGNGNGNEDKNKSETKKFSIPAILEIKEYCKERKNDVDSKKFLNFYESKGWMVGKNKMKDWRACVRTWEETSHNHNPVVNNVKTL